MTSNLINKEYIKNLINRNNKNEITSAESKALENTLLNLSKDEWKSLKIISKEILQEELEKKFLVSEKIPNDWKNDAKDFFNSLINLGYALINEDMIYEMIQLAKVRGINNQTKLTPFQYQQLGEEMALKILIPNLIKQLDKIAAWARSITVKDYHAAETSWVKKIKKSINQIQTKMMSVAFLKTPPTKEELLKIISNCKNMSVEEMRVGKDKLKAIGMMAFDYFAPAETKNHPEARQLVQSFLNFWDAVVDEKLLVETTNLAVDIVESVVRNPQFDPKNEKMVQEIFLNEISSPQRISQFHNLLKGWTNHFNQLAGEETQNSYLSSTAENNITSKISTIQNSPTGNNDNSDTSNTFNLLSNTPNSLISSFYSNGGTGNPSLSWTNFLLKAQRKLTTVESKGKWYKSPWFIGSVVVLVIGGLAVWLFTRRKKEKITYDENSNSTW